MNKIYKVVFNHAKGQYQVVPEIAKSHGKSSKSSLLSTFINSGKGLAKVSVLALVLMGGINSAYASGNATVTDGVNLVGGTNITVAQEDSNTITINTTGLATSAELSTLQGTVNTNTTDISTLKTDVGQNKSDLNALTTKVDNNKTTTDQSITNLTNTVTSNKTATDNAISTLTGTVASNKTEADTKITNLTNTVANNKTDTDNRLSVLTTTVANNKADADANIRANKDRLDALDKALGIDANQAGIRYFHANSKGSDSSATGTEAIAIGSGTKASKSYALGAGYKADARGEASVAIGEVATVAEDATNGVAIGTKSFTGAQTGMTADEGSGTVLVGGGMNSVSIGNEANARANSSIALGDGATVTNDASKGNILSANGVAIGTDSKTSSDNGTAIGFNAHVTYGSSNAIAIGTSSSATKENSIAVGTGATASLTNALALGISANAGNFDTIAIGRNSNSGGGASIAIGSASSATSNNVIAIGNAANSTTKYSISIGDAAGTGMIADGANVNGTHIAIGKSSGQNVNGSENISLGTGAGSNVKGSYNIAIGSGAGDYIGDSSPGSVATSLDGRNVSIGYKANGYTSSKVIAGATALGAQTVASTEGTAVGSQANAQGNGSTAIGWAAVAVDDKALAIGEESRAEGSSNVAIGGGSLATTVMANGTAYLTDTIATKVVSVGNSTGDGENLRRIVNVADGSAAQDAVTVNQLKALETKLAKDIVNSIPNGGTSGNAVTYSGPNNEYVELKNPDSTKPNKPILIKNVAAGMESTDAVNKGQMDQAIASGKTHFFSVKEDPNTLQKNNYSNDGASGYDSMAVGIVAKSVGIRSMSVGNNVTAESLGSIALGVGYMGSDNTIVETKATAGYSYNMAIGAGAQSSGDNAIAIGTRAVTKPQLSLDPNSSKESVAIGYLAESSNTRAIALGAEAKSVGISSVAVGDTARATGDDSIAIGSHAMDNNAEKSIAMGNDAMVSDGVSTAVIGDSSSASGTNKSNVFGTNSSVTGNSLNSAAVSENTLIGNNSTIAKKDATAITNVTASGNRNTVGGISDAGTAATAGLIDKVNINGTGNTVTVSNNGKNITDVTIAGNDNTVAAANIVGGADLSKIQILGSNVTATVGNSVYLGSNSAAYATPSTTTAGVGKYDDPYPTAAKSATGAVTLGDVGSERRLQNLASGLVSATSTDAINGSQLYYRTLPLRFAGDNSTVGATTAQDVNVIQRSADQALSIRGGANTSNLTDNNIGVISNTADNTLTVKLAKDLTGLTSVTATTVNATTVKAGDTTINTNGMTINGGPSITKTGINAAKTKITNVTAGTADTDAVNVSQLNTLETKLTQKGFSLTAEDANSVKKELGQSIDVVGDKKNISTKVADGKVQVTMADDITLASVTTKDAAGNKTVMTGTGVVITSATGTSPVSLTTTGLNNGGNKITNVAIGTADTDAVNVSQLNQQKTDLIAKGFGLKAETGATVNKPLGDFVDVIGDGNTFTLVDGGKIKVALSKELSVTSVTTTDKDGNVTTTNGSGVTIKPVNGGNTVSITTAGVDNGGNKIINVKAGEADTDAVNVGQLKAQINANATKLEEGTNTSVTGTGTVDDPFKVNLNDNITLGTQGTKDGSVTVVGVTGASVAMNGKDGSITMAGANGANPITIVSAAGTTLGNTSIARINYKDGETTHVVATLDDGLTFAGNTGSVNKTLNSTMTIKGTGTKADTEYSSDNIKTIVNADGELLIGLDKNLAADSVVVGGEGKDGKDGVNGSIGVKGADGKDGVTITSVGKDGADGTDGHIGINGKDGASADIHVVQGPSGVDGQDGIDRIVYEDHNGNTQTIATLNDGMKYGGDIGDVIAKKLNEQVNVVGGITDATKLSDNNLGVVSDGTGNLAVKLSKELTGLTSVTTGDTTMTTNGITINNGTTGGQTVSITKDGLNNGGNKIINVAAGEADTDAVNVKQLKDLETTITDKGFALQAQDGNKVQKDLGEAVEVVGDNKNISTAVVDGKIQVSMKDAITVTSVTAQDGNGNSTVTNATGTTTKDAAGNTTTTTATGTTTKDTAGNTTAITSTGVTITSSTGSTVSLTTSGLDNGGNQIHNVAAGTKGTDAVNVDQLRKEIADNATQMANGKNTTVTGTGTKADPFKVNLNDNITLGENGTTDGSVTVAGANGSSVAINGKDGSITMAGANGANALTMTSTQGAAGLDGSSVTRIAYKDAEGTTHEVATLNDGLAFAGNTGSVNKTLNSTMTIKGTGTKADTEYSSDNIKTIVNGAGELVIGLDKNIAADSVVVGGAGKDGKDGVNGAIGVKGADGKDGVTISSVGKDGANGTDGHIGINGKDGASADIHVVQGPSGVDGKDGMDRIVYEDHSGNTQTIATLNDGMKYGGDTGATIAKKLNEQVNVVGGITDESKLTTTDNIGVVSDGTDNLKVKLSKDLTGLDSVTTKTINAETGAITTVNSTTVNTTTLNATTINAGNTTINNNGITIQSSNGGQSVSLTDAGLNNGGNKITNVGAGDISPMSTDAVNGSQLFGAERRISNLREDLNKVGAGAAALAALHPLDFDPDNKWDVAAGVGHYKNATAGAVGMFYRPNEDTMFSIGGTVGNGDNMINAGVSIKLGTGSSNVTSSRVAMAKEIKQLRSELEAMKSAMLDVSVGKKIDTSKLQLFPDVPQNHWAYEYVAQLAGNGLIQGYPAGNFDGERPMTRYEFAAMLYRAMTKGAVLSDKLLNEFSRELEYFTVDTIARDSAGNPTIQRVRVVEANRNK